MDEKSSHSAEVENVATDKVGQSPPDTANVKIESYEINPVLEKKVVRKADIHVIPILFVLFLLAYLDR